MTSSVWPARHVAEDLALRRELGPPIAPAAVAVGDVRAEGEGGEFGLLDELSTPHLRRTNSRHSTDRLADVQVIATAPS